MRLANFSNGLAYEHDDICYFQSNFGHSAKKGYFRIDAISLKAIICLLKGEKLEIVDATSHKKKYTDAQKFGVPTWCIVFNRALNFKGSRHIEVCPWQTREMKGVALSRMHKPMVQNIRKLQKLFGYKKPAIIGDNVILTCGTNVDFDDNAKRLKRLLYKEE